MNDEERIYRDFWQGAGYTAEQIETMEANRAKKQEIMNRPDSDSEKVALIFQQIKDRSQKQ